MSPSTSTSTSTYDTKANVWYRFCDRIKYFAPEIVETMCTRDDVINDICDIASNDMSKQRNTLRSHALLLYQAG